MKVAKSSKRGCFSLLFLLLFRKNATVTGLQQQHVFYRHALCDALPINYILYVAKDKDLKVEYMLLLHTSHLFYIESTFWLCPLNRLLKYLHQPLLLAALFNLVVVFPCNERWS